MKQDWQNNYFLVLFAAAALHGLYLAILIALKADKKKSLQFLSLLLVAITAVVCNYLLYISNAILSYPNLLGLLTPIMYLAGPTFYFFIRKSADIRFKFHLYDLAHLLPILFFVYQSFQVFKRPVEAKLAAIHATFSQTAPPIIEIILGSTFSLVTAAYVIASLFILSDRLTYKPSPSLQWLRQFSFTFLLLLALSVAVPIAFVLLEMSGAFMELTVTLLFVLSIHALGYVILQKDLNSKWGPMEKYATSPLDPQLLETYRLKISSHLQNQKPWLLCDFSIGDLSRQLNMPKHHLSQVLNEEMNISFNDLINNYRIEEVKRRLSSGATSKYSVFGVASDCGFSSKSTFNRIFKKSTGLTPTTYLQTYTAGQPLSST